MTQAQPRECDGHPANAVSLSATCWSILHTLILAVPEALRSWQRDQASALRLDMNLQSEPSLVTFVVAI